MDCNEIWHRGGPQGRKGSGFFWSSTPNPCGYRVQKGGVGWIRSHRGAFWQKLYKQKFQCAPNLVGAGHFGPQILILKDLDPISFCSNGHSLSKGVNKIKVVVYVPNSYLVRLNTLYPDPHGPGGHGHSLSRRVGKSKVVGDHPKSYFVGLDIPYPDLCGMWWLNG